MIKSTYQNKASLRTKRSNPRRRDGFGTSCLAMTGIMICASVLFYNLCFAKTTEELTKCICEAGAGETVCLEELKNLYFKENKYTDFVELLKSLCPDNKAIQPAINYYIALSRYSQLKYLEESRGWDEYFAKGNDYRDDIANGTEKAIKATTPKDTLHIYARLLLYQFHKGQQDTFVDSALTDLMSSVSEYAQSSNDLKIIKEVADKLLDYDEKGRSKELYKIYAEKLASSEIKDAELKDIAANFYKDGKIELAENIYDIYIERISKALAKEKLIPELISIVGDFTYKDNGPNDMFYAEKLFKNIEGAGGKNAFDEKLMYLRGFNLEKAKSYAQAKDIYIDFIKRFPRSNYTDELLYKIGIIYTYALRDLKEGRDYFEQLIQRPSVSPHSLAGLYQLGLLKQWEGDLPKAREYYDKLMEKLGTTDPDRLTLTQERLKEVAEGKPLEYNLKIGLDTALKEEYANLNMSKLSLKANFYQPEKGQEVDLESVVSLGPTGCLQIELQYLWSGDMGGVKPSTAQSGFKTSYKSPGTELIILVLVSPEGITERSVDIIDVH